MSDVLYRATKYMNAEDALLAREERPKKREGHVAGQGAEDGKNWRTTRGQRLQAPHGEVYKLHLANCLDKPSLDADQR